MGDQVKNYPTKAQRTQRIKRFGFFINTKINRMTENELATIAVDICY